MRTTGRVVTVEHPTDRTRTVRAWQVTFHEDGCRHAESGTAPARSEQADLDRHGLDVVWMPSRAQNPPYNVMRGCRRCGTATPSAPQAAEPRTYCVGLPVIITVHDDGRVEYDVDTSEAAQGISENPPDGVSDEQADADADRVERHHNRLVIDHYHPDMDDEGDPADVWAEHARFPVADWQYEVANGDTRLGYAAWCDTKADNDDEPTP